MSMLDQLDTSATHADSVYELYHRAIVDDDLEAKYAIADLEEEQRRREAEEAYWIAEERRLEREQWHYFDVVVMRRHLPHFTYRRPLGRERRVACNHRQRGSRRAGSGSRAGPDDTGDGDPDGEHHPLAVRDTAGAAR